METLEAERSGATPTSQPILAVRNLSKSYDGACALQHVSLELHAGEIHALVGENGAGKSTLTKIITGTVDADSGIIEFSGRVISRNNPTTARALGIAAIYQQPTLFPHLTVTENIALSLEMGSTHLTVDWRSRHKRAASLIESLGASIDPRRLAGSLSMADQQIVEIAKAIGANAKVLLMDEPTAVLTENEVERVFALTRLLRDSGVAIVYISHRLEEVLALAGRITVLRDGHSIATRSAASVSRDELIQMMVGRSIASVYPKRPVQLGDVALELRNVRNGRNGLHDISFSVRQGEIFGLAGMVGSGRTTLARTLFGLAELSCEVSIAGRPHKIHSPSDAIRIGIGYLPEDRRQHGVILDMQVSMNISLASLGAVSRWTLIDKKKERDLATQYVDRLRIKTASVAATAGQLSGGNQQKVALSRWLATRPRILILDEPTQGVDVGSKSEIHELIVQLAEQGMSILLISSEMPEILGMCDRIGVFHAGTLAGILSASEASQSRIMSLALGHGQLSPGKFN